MSAARDDQGLAIVLALVVTTLLGALGITLLLVSDTERRFSSNDRIDQAVRYAAGAALERGLADVGAMPDWTAILSGRQGSAFTDATRRPLLASGQPMDLDSLTADLQAASYGGASFGANTPVWRLFAWGPVLALDPAILPRSGEYLAVWVADDLSEIDGDPFSDSNGTLVMHAEAFGLGASRREVEAIVERTNGRLRVTAWRER